MGWTPKYTAYMLALPLFFLLLFKHGRVINLFLGIKRMYAISFVFNSPFIYFCLLDTWGVRTQKLQWSLMKAVRFSGLGARIPGSEDFAVLVWIFPAGIFPLGPQNTLRSPQKDEKCTQTGTMNGQASVFNSSVQWGIFGGEEHSLSSF